MHHPKTFRMISRNRSLCWSAFGMSARPPALVRVLPINDCMARGDQLLLHVGTINKQLSHRAAIAVCCDASDAYFTPNDKRSQVVSCCFGRYRVGTFATQFWSVDTSQSDFFACVASAGVAVVAGGNQD